MEFDEHPFGKDDLSLLGLEAGGTYETVVLVDIEGEHHVKPLGLHVTSCGLFVTIFLPSRAFEGTDVGDRLFISIPSYRDISLFERFLSGKPTEDGVVQPFERSSFPKLADLPGLLVEVAAIEEGEVTDERGTAGVRYLFLKPLHSEVPVHGWTPICRAHSLLVEASIAITRGERDEAASLLERASRTAPYSLRETVRLMENLI